jgi:hypothetical protein
VYRLKWAPEVAGTDDIDAAGKDVEGEGDADESGVSIAFRADLTRVVTFLGHARGHDARLSRDRRLRRTPSHHAPQYNPEQMEKVTRINEYHTAQLASWLGRLKATAGGDGNTLDACASKDRHLVLPHVDRVVTKRSAWKICARRSSLDQSWPSGCASGGRRGCRSGPGCGGSGATLDWSDTDEG